MNKPTHGGYRPGAGRKPVQRKHKQITITLPPDVYDRVMEAKGNGKLSHLIAKILREALGETR